MPESYVKAGGVWKAFNKPYVKVSGTHKELKNIYNKVSGVWQLVYEGAIVVTNDSTVSNYNLFTMAGSPPSAVNVIFYNTGIIYATTTGTAALVVSGFAPGSTVTIINSGQIYGKGGNGGDGRSGSSAGTPGGDGGPAISLGLNVTIDNSGWIYGGGAGGGGGGGATFSSGDCTSGKTAYGGGGGGGQSYSVASGGNGPGGATNGTDGNISSSGGGGNRSSTTFNHIGRDTESGLCDIVVASNYTIYGGNGGSGGSFGTSGASGGNGSRSGGSGLTITMTSLYSGYSSGVGGNSIIKNGYTITWQSGESNVSGAIS